MHLTFKLGYNWKDNLTAVSSVCLLYVCMPVCGATPLCEHSMCVWAL